MRTGFCIQLKFLEWISAVESTPKEPLFHLCKWASSVDTQECCSSEDNIGKGKMQEKSDGTQIRRRGTTASSGSDMFLSRKYMSNLAIRMC